MQFQKGQYSLGNFCLVQCSLVQFRFLQCKADYCSSAWTNSLQCSAVQYKSVDCTNLPAKNCSFCLCIHSAAQLLKALLWLHIHQYMILYMGRIHQDGYQFMNLVPSNYSSDLNLFCKSDMMTYLVTGRWGLHQKKKKYFYPLNTVKQKNPHKANSDPLDMCGQQHRYQNKTKMDSKKKK